MYAYLKWSTLSQVNEDTFATEDGTTSIRFNDATCQTLLLTMAPENVCAELTLASPSPLEPARFSSGATYTFAHGGEFHCAPLDATLPITKSGDSHTIRFSSIFGTGIAYPLTVLNNTTAWFDIACGVDEAPPGCVMVVLDKVHRQLVLSAMLARRILFHAR